MHFDETTGRRAEIALERLAEGSPIVFRNVALRLEPSGALECTVFSRNTFGENVTPAGAEQELAEGEAALEQLLSESRPFAEFVSGRPRTWALRLDIGTASITLCRRVGDKLVWSQRRAP